MNKRGGGLFDIIMVLLVMVGIVTIIFLTLNMFGESVEEKFKPVCVEACEKYGFEYFDVAYNSYGYDTAECWCLDNDGLPRQAPIEIITDNDDDSWITKFWDNAKKLWGRK